MSILVYIEKDQGKIKSSSYEAVSYAAVLGEKTGAEVSAVGLGSLEGSEWEAHGSQVDGYLMGSEGIYPDPAHHNGSRAECAYFKDKL